MELTDAIRNKHFENVLDTHLCKTSNEYASLAALKFCYGEKYRNLKHAEAPDFQDKKNSVGIEVTDSITQKDAQNLSEFVKFAQAKNDKERNKCKYKIIKNGAKLNGDGSMMTHLARDFENMRDEIIVAFSQKLKKVASYREKGFKHIGILIYHEKPIFSDIEQQLSKWLEETQKGCIYKFDFVYIFHLDGILFYDFATGELNSVSISHKDRQALSNLGRMAAEGEVKDDDPIWL